MLACSIWIYYLKANIYEVLTFISFLFDKNALKVLGLASESSIIIFKCGESLNL